VSAADNGSGPGIWERLRRGLRGGAGRGILPIGEAFHPVTLAAMAILVVNDWVLKRTWPGAITGKLSDLAGLAAAPVVLTALVGLALMLARRLGARVEPYLTHTRLVAATLATGAGFAAIKLSPRVAGWFIRALGVFRPASVAPDRTDLWCLPMLVVAYWIGRDELRRLRAPPIP
jgi:hypothetical protein